MDTELNPHEARVLGVLIEKGYCTPDQYPLSLNAATNGCNQKSNRNPLVDFSEAEVTVALQGLVMKHLVGSMVPAGSRVEKYRHNAKEHFSLGDTELAVLAELLLRGPQAPGELRTRASRMRTIESLDELKATLGRLIERGFVKRLPPSAGSRAERFVQLVAKELHVDDPEPARASAPEAPALAVPSMRPAPANPLDARVAKLEERVETLTRQLSGLADKLGEPLEG